MDRDKGERRDLSWEQYQIRSRAIHQRTDRLVRMIIDRARREAKDAGLDPTIPFLHAHNAIVSWDNGRPWPEVNYRKARKVLWLERRSWDVGRITDRVIARLWGRVKN